MQYQGSKPIVAGLRGILQAGSERWPLANVVGLLGAGLTIFCLLVLPADQFWNIRLPLYLLVAIWIFLRPRVALYLMPAAVAWGTLDPANLGGLHASDILTFLLAASWLASYALRNTLPSWRAGPLDRGAAQDSIPRYLALALGALLLAMLLSTLTTTGLTLSVKELVKWLEVLILLLLGLQYVRTQQQIWLLVIMILLASISQALLGYAQSFFALGPSSFVRGDSLRVYGTFDQPNPFAGYLNMGLCIAIALTCFAGDWKTRILAGGTVLLLGGAVYLTQSKGGWLALAIALICMFILGLPRLRVWIGIAGLLTLCLIAAYLAGLIPDSLVMSLLKKTGLTQISFTMPRHYNFANAERLAHWVAGLNMFLAHPLSGVGIGNYGTVYNTYAPAGRFDVPLGHAHNYYINIAAEAGILGLLTLLGFLLTVFVAGGRSYRVVSMRWLSAKTGQNSNLRALAIGLVGALVTVCAHNLVDNLYVHGMTNLFALLSVLLIRLETRSSNSW
jgi:O-antigen ligase